MDTESIAKIMSGLLSGGVAANVTSALAEGLKLANKLMEPDPAKRAKARRDYYLSLMQIITEVQGGNEKDVSDLVTEFANLLNE